jgi:hypothetical protein
MAALLYRIECKKCQCGPARCECWYKHPNEKAIQSMIDDWECFMPRPDELFDDAIMEGICRTPDWRYLYAFSSTDAYKKHVSAEQEKALIEAGFGVFEIGSGASAIDEKEGQAIIFYPDNNQRPEHKELTNGIYN